MFPDDTEGITPEQLVAKYQNLRGQPRVKALEDIDQINWSALHHAYGDAMRFPSPFAGDIFEL